VDVVQIGAPLRDPSSVFALEESPVGPLRKQVTCECRWTAKGTEDELVPQIQKHGREVHGIEVTREQAVAQLVPA
jgi:predicted small metal-binding protein